MKIQMFTLIFTGAVGIITDGCKDNHYREPLYGRCMPCLSVPSPLTEAYNRSCYSRNICTNGYWGPNCTKKCSAGCVGNICHKRNGACRKGCKPCYTGPFCHTDSNTTHCICDTSAKCTCMAGYYGDRCLLICNANCKYDTCDNKGECTHGCKTGWYGPKCDKQCNNCHINTCSLQTGTCSEGCKAGYYGLKCTRTCNSNCVNKTCNQTDGRCKKCEPGLFGDTCDKVCPVNCESDSCNISDGSCFSCRPGFTGNHCNMSCPDKCATASCYQSDGSCHGCKGGYKGSHCGTSCSVQCTACDQYGEKCSSCNTGWYGQTCHEYCDNCLGNICDIRGTCQDGCNDGWFRDKCDGECNTGCMHRRCGRFKGECESGCIPTAYGVYCNNSCSNHCLGNLCQTATNDKTTPYCTNGCIDGWWGDYCDDKCHHHCLRCDRFYGDCLKCELNRFGEDCSKKCSDHCSTSRCNMTGVCMEGCKKGSWGLKCKNDCPQHCTVCNRENGHCDQCEGSLYGRSCNMTCSSRCIEPKCNMTGVCTEGCKKGSWGPKCENDCPKHCIVCNRENGHCDQCEGSLYGPSCNMTCSRGCMEPKCNMTSFCLEGCQDGRHGKMCYNSCDSSCRKCDQITGGCTHCIDGWTGSTCEESTKKGVVVLWVVVPSVLIIILLILPIFVMKRNRTKMKRKMFSSTGISVDMLSVVNPSYVGTPKGSSTPSEVESWETQPLTGDDKRIKVQLRDDVKKKEGPCYQQLIIHPHIFSTPIRSDLIQEEEGRPEDTPYPCQLPDEPHLGCVWSTEVRVENFRNYVKSMKKNLGLTNQFFDLPYGRLGPCDEGERQVNAFKNRYRNILPYDHSRVTLQYIDGIPGSDYINANFINGYGKPKAFVASQGPYGEVMWDFWRMVWEIDTDKIVMLTNLVENRKNKCEQYWPDLGQPQMNYDGVLVQCVSENQVVHYTIRTFTVQMEEEPSRIVQQYHFTTWPDKGVPRDVTSLVDFHQVVKKSPTSRYGPVIVHCSAGVGRTGTFLALDYLIAQARAECVVDVYECVTRIRHQRMDAIQTEEQYIFLHDALVEALPSGDRPSMKNTVTRGTKKNQKLNCPSKRQPGIPKSRFTHHSPNWDDKPYHTHRPLDSPL